MPSKILIADDDALFIARLENALRSAEGHIRTAYNAADAEQSIAEGDFDVVVLEPNLPGRSWYGLLNTLRTLKRGARVVLVTSFPSGALWHAAAAVGVCARFSKPADPEVIAAVARGEEVESDPPRPLSLALADIEWEHINDMILRCDGNMAKAARRLGIPRQTLYRKLRKHPGTTCATWRGDMLRREPGVYVA